MLVVVDIDILEFVEIYGIDFYILIKKFVAGTADNIPFSRDKGRNILVSNVVGAAGNEKTGII